MVVSKEPFTLVSVYGNVIKLSIDSLAFSGSESILPSISSVWKFSTLCDPMNCVQPNLQRDLQILKTSRHCTKSSDARQKSISAFQCSKGTI